MSLVWNFASTCSIAAAFFVLIVYNGGFIFLQSSDKTHLPPESSPLPSEFPPSYTSLEENAKKERGRLEELIRAKGMKYGSYPRFTVALKGQKVSIMTPSRMGWDYAGYIEKLKASAPYYVWN